MGKLAMFLYVSFLAVVAHAASPCPGGIWDLGPRVAALQFTCAEDGTAQLSFCNREVVMAGRPCNHLGLPLRCAAEEETWLCTDGDRYRAETRWRSGEEIHYKFKGSFSEGEFLGRRFRDRPNIHAFPGSYEWLRFNSTAPSPSFAADP